MTTVKVHLRHPLELRAFAKFCEEMADISPQVDAYQDARYGGFGTTGAIAPAEAPVGNGVETAPETGNEPATDAPKRERGKPSPGRARRTKEEIAEDDAAGAAVVTRYFFHPESESLLTTSDGSFPAGDGHLNEIDKQQFDEIAAKQAAAISTTPEDRQDPENPEPADDAETVAQDAADEAAETAETKTGLTLDDVRTVLGIYVKAYGMAAAQVDGPKVIATVLGKAHDPNAPCKVSDIPDDKIEAVIAAIKLAGKENRFGREAVVSE